MVEPVTFRCPHCRKSVSQNAFYNIEHMVARMMCCERLVKINLDPFVIEKYNGIAPVVLEIQPGHTTL